jgi:hypothetical protein
LEGRESEGGRELKKIEEIEEERDEEREIARERERERGLFGSAGWVV